MTSASIEPSIDPIWGSVGTLPLQQDPYGLDFNRDSVPDMLWRNSDTGDNVVWFMGGHDNSQITGHQLLEQVGGSWDIKGIADFNADNRPDILWRDPLSGQNVVWFMGGADNGQITGHQLLTQVGGSWDIKGIADFNADNRPDILWRDSLSGQNVVWFMGGADNGQITGHQLLTQVGGSWNIKGIADFNADNRPDILWRDPLSGQNVVWFMGGADNGQITGHQLLTQVGGSWDIKGIADFNADNRPDILWREPLSGQNVVWFMGGNDNSQITGHQLLTPVAGNWNPILKGWNPATVTAAQPNGANALKVGFSYELNWSDNFTANVSLDLYKGSNFYRNIISSTTSDGSYLWTLPTDLEFGSDYRLKVSSIENGAISDLSDNYFAILSGDNPDLVIQNQTATAVVRVGDTVNIGAYTKNIGETAASSHSIRYWLSDDITLDVAADRLLGDDLVTANTLEVGSSDYDSMSFIYETGWGTGTKYILFQADGDGQVAESDETNNIAYQAIFVQPVPFIDLLSLNGGDSLTTGDAYTLTWSDNIDENVKLELYKGDSVVKTIDAFTISDGTFVWTVPMDLSKGDDYRIKISSVNAPNVYDYSDSYFSLDSDSFNINFDYRFDTNGWFTPTKKAALEAAAEIWEEIIQDEFADVPVGTQLMTINPQTGEASGLTSDYVIDDLTIFVGARNLNGSTLGLAGATGSWYIGSDLDTRYNGEDFQPWTGYISFNTSSSWHFDDTPLPSDIIPEGYSDFVSVAVHEIAHVLGISSGINAFGRYVQIINGQHYFTGPNVVAKNGNQFLHLEADGSHVEDGYDHAGYGEALMDPTLTVGTRKLPTVIDIALLDDIGYGVTYSV